MGRRIIIHNHLPRTKDVNAFEHNVSREQEEKNRDKAYKDAGITRIGKDGGPGSGPQGGGSGKAQPFEKELKAKWKAIQATSEYDQPRKKKLHAEFTELMNKQKAHPDFYVNKNRDGGPGSGPQEGGGSHPEVEKHLNSDPSKMDKAGLQQAYGEVSRLIAKRSGSVKNYRGSREETLLNGHLAEIGNAMKKAKDVLAYRANDDRRRKAK